MNTGKKVLLIEDDFDIREIVKLILSEEGYEVSELDNGHEIDAELLRSFPDIILLDVMLGDMDGREICADLKSAKSTTLIPIIIVSATHKQQAMQEKGCLADDFLQKPFDISDLIRKVNLYTAA